MSLSNIESHNVTIRTGYNFYAVIADRGTITQIIPFTTPEARRAYIKARKDAMKTSGDRFTFDVFTMNREVR